MLYAALQHKLEWLNVKPQEENKLHLEIHFITILVHPNTYDSEIDLQKVPTTYIEFLKFFQELHISDIMS